MKSMDKLTTGVAYGTSAGSAGSRINRDRSPTGNSFCASVRE